MGFALTYPGKLIFGRGCIKQLPAEIGEHGESVLLVTGATGLRASGVLERVLARLSAEGHATHVFDEVEPDPSLATVERGVALAREQDIEVVVGIGGGSTLDAAKAIAATQPESVRVYHAGKGIEHDGLPTATSGAKGTGFRLSSWSTRRAVFPPLPFAPPCPLRLKSSREMQRVPAVQSRAKESGWQTK